MTTTTATTWHRIKRADFYALSIDSHDADQCPYEGAPCTLGGCPAEVVEPGSDRFDARDSWMQWERDLRAMTTADRASRLTDLHSEALDVEHRTASAVNDARMSGMAWSAIGSALGITRQAAQQRYGRGF